MWIYNIVRKGEVMNKFAIMIIIGCSLLAGEVYLYKYNSDGTPYSKTKESSGEVYMYTNLYTEIKNMEISTKLIADIRKSSNIDGLNARAFAFCSAWNDIASKEKTCKEFASKVVEKLLYPNKKLQINIYNIKSSDYRWVSKNRYLEVQE